MPFLSFRFLLFRFSVNKTFYISCCRWSNSGEHRNKVAQNVDIVSHSSVIWIAVHRRNNRQLSRNSVQRNFVFFSTALVERSTTERHTRTSRDALDSLATADIINIGLKINLKTSRWINITIGKQKVIRKSSRSETISSSRCRRVHLLLSWCFTFHYSEAKSPALKSMIKTDAAGERLI